MRRYIVLSSCLLLSSLTLPCLAQAPASDPESIDTRLQRIELLLQSRGLLEMLQQLDRLEQEVSSLRGEIEVQNHTLEQLQQRQRALYMDIDQRMQSLEPSGTHSEDTALVFDGETAIQPAITDPPLQTLAPTTGPVTEAPVTSDNNSPTDLQLSPLSPSTFDTPDLTPRPVSNTPVFTPGPGLDNQNVSNSDPHQTKREYDQAFTLLKQSQYEQAIQAFREYLGKYPVSDYSDNAQYWLGEAFYVLKQFEQAADEYNRLIVNYPDSQKYTHALLKIGYSQYELGMYEEARQTLEQLQLNYPGTTPSRLADERLKMVTTAINERQLIDQGSVLEP